MTDKNWLLKTIVTKSDQLNAEDLITGPITVTVEGVTPGTDEQPVVIAISGDQQPVQTMQDDAEVTGNGMG